MLHILKCKKCGSYTLKKRCSCDGEAVTAVPAKYSAEDRFAKYRRKAKEALR